MSTTCDPGDIFDPSGNDLNLDFDRGSDCLPHAPIIVSESPCYNGRPVIKTTQGQLVNLVLPVTDRNGVPIELVNECSDSSSSDNGSSSIDPATLCIRFQAKADMRLLRLAINKVCTVRDPEKGLVEVTLTEQDLRTPGLQPAQLAVYSEDGEDLYQVTPYWLHVAPSLHAQNCGPLTIAEVRMVLADQCPEANTLLGDLEFTDEEIALYMRRPVDEFNEKHAPATNYTMQNFPWRYHWSIATGAYLLRMKAIILERNKTHYQAGGGVSIVGDDDYGPSYMNISKQLMEQWQAFLVSKKRMLNFEGGFATQQSGYAYIQRTGWW